MRETMWEVVVHVSTGLGVAAVGGGFATLVFMWLSR